AFHQLAIDIKTIARIFLVSPGARENLEPSKLSPPLAASAFFPRSTAAHRAGPRFSKAVLLQKPFLRAPCSFLWAGWRHSVPHLNRNSACPPPKSARAPQSVATTARPCCDCEPGRSIPRRANEKFLSERCRRQRWQASPSLEARQRCRRQRWQASPSLEAR